MYSIQRSALFKRQALSFVKDYQIRAGRQIASQFIDGLEQAIEFIAKHPQACRIYTHVGGHDFRKWPVKGFPHSIYFRVDGSTIVLETLYAHKMDVEHRLFDDLEQAD